MEKILSNSELVKTLLESAEDETTFIGGNCKIIFSSEPANLKFVLCDVEIENQDMVEDNRPKECILNNITQKDTNNIAQKDIYLEEIKSLKAELKKNNELLENILAVVEEIDPY